VEVQRAADQATIAEMAAAAAAAAAAAEAYPVLYASKSRSTSSRTSSGSQSPQRPPASERTTGDTPGAGMTAVEEGAKTYNQVGEGHRKLDKPGKVNAAGSAAGNDGQRGTHVVSRGTHVLSLSHTCVGTTETIGQRMHTVALSPHVSEQHRRAAGPIGDLASYQAPTPVSSQTSPRTILNTTVLRDSTAEARVISVAQSGVIGEIPPAVHPAPLEVHEKSSILPCPGDLPKDMAVARTPSSFVKMLEAGASAFTRSMLNLNQENVSALLSRGKLFGGGT
jgi:hypothetical protein